MQKLWKKFFSDKELQDTACSWLQTRPTNIMKKELRSCVMEKCVIIEEVGLVLYFDIYQSNKTFFKSSHLYSINPHSLF